MGPLTTVLAYLGPETMLPMTSVVAGAAGVLMMFGRNGLRWCSTAIRGVDSKSRPFARPAGPSRAIGEGQASRAKSRAMEPAQP